MAEIKMQLAEWLDDLCVRFILNLPQEELESAERICFQVEEAQWFYEDFVRPLDPSLPSMTLRTFCMAIFRVCPLLSSFTPEHHMAAYSQFLAYKTRVPVRGAILLNHSMDHVLLVKGWKKGANWSFPRGKINKDEKDLDCAIREVYEETGYDLAQEGLVPNEANIKSLEVTMKGQHMKLYVFRNVSMDTSFQARTRKEISKIDWWKLSSLPGYHKKKKQTQASDKNQDDSGDSIKANKLYMVAPFLPQLRKWIGQQRRQDSHKRTTSDAYLSTGDAQVTDGDNFVDDDLLSDLPASSVAPMAHDFSTALPQVVSQSSATTFPHSTYTDSAIQMKRMLGLADGPPTNAPGGDLSHKLGTHQQGLLGTLRSEAKDNLLPSEHTFPSTVPLVQVHREMSAQEGSRHGPLRPPQVSGGQAYPHFPYSAAQAQASPAYPDHSQSAQVSSGSRSGELRREGYTSNATTTQFPLGGMAQSAVQPGSQVPHTSSIFHRSYNEQPIGSRNPAVSRPLHEPGQQTFDVPPASQLPQPKLNNHAMSLLSMFKAGKSEPSHEQRSILERPTQKSDVPMQARNSHSDFKAPSVDKRTKQSKPSQPQQRVAFGSLIPSTVSPPAVSSPSKPPVQTHQKARPGKEKAKASASTLSHLGDKIEPSTGSKESLQEGIEADPGRRPNTLLTLLKTEAKGGTETQLEPESSPPKPYTAEEDNKKALLRLLGKSSSPPNSSQNIARETKGKAKAESQPSTVAVNSQAGNEPSRQPNYSKEEPHPPSLKGSPQILQRPPQQTLSAQVATEPITHQIKQQERTAPKRRNKPPKTALQKAEQKLQGRTAPVQILKRPAPPESQPQESQSQNKPAPARPESTSAQKSPTKPFVPQILRRPNQDSNTSTAQRANDTVRPNTTTTSDKGQQHTLLSLLDRSQHGRRPPTPKDAKRVGSSNHAESSGSSLPQSPGVGPDVTSSRISGIVSPSAGEASARSRLNSATSIPHSGTPVRSGRDSVASQTPISPADKGFLVNYLEGVIGKGGSK